MPELKDFPAKYIYEPWKAPVVDQKRAGCLVRGDGSTVAEEGGVKVYPRPMFDFDERRTVCIKAMKSAYGVGLYGDHPKVLDGTWRELFPDDGEGPTEGKNAIEAAMSGSKTRIMKDVDTRDGDMGVDEDEGEAAERGGEGRGGDNDNNGVEDEAGDTGIKARPGKRKREILVNTGKGKEKGQVTVDGLMKGKKVKVKR